MRCEYILTILHTAVGLLEGLVILPQMNISGDESSGRVDYAIKKILDDLLEEIICITEGKQNQPEKGVAQNLMQCRSSCDVSNIKFLFIHTLSNRYRYTERFENKVMKLKFKDKNLKDKTARA